MANTSDNPLPIGHELTEGRALHAVTVYGTASCEDSTRSRALLDREGIEYNYYDVELDAAMARTAWSLQNGGQKTPVVDLGEGLVLVEPSDEALLSALRQSGRLPVSG